MRGKNKGRNLISKPIIILGQEIDPEGFPNLYRLGQRNPQGLAEQLQSIATAWHEGSILSAMHAAESDLAHG